jgi:hypothetical protein
MPSVNGQFTICANGDGASPIKAYMRDFCTFNSDLFGVDITDANSTIPVFHTPPSWALLNSTKF